MSTCSAVFTLRDGGTLLRRRGLAKGGKVQQCIDRAVLFYNDAYVPMASGAYKNSGISATKIGSGRVVYDVPYARQRYRAARHNGLRGPYHFARMKVDHKRDILLAAAAVSGGKGK